MKKVFLDCGGHKGQSVKKAIEIYGSDIDIFSFEPSPLLWPFFNELPTTLIKKAVSDKYETVPFYLGRYSLGSTLFKNKKTGAINYEEPIMVETVDLSSWIKENIPLESYIILKLNVEGAEIPVLRKMIDDGTLARVKELYCNFHYNRFIGGDKNVDRKVIGDVFKYGIVIKKWIP